MKINTPLLAPADVSSPGGAPYNPFGSTPSSDSPALDSAAPVSPVSVSPSQQTATLPAGESVTPGPGGAGGSAAPSAPALGSAPAAGAVAPGQTPAASTAPSAVSMTPEQLSQLAAALRPPAPSAGPARQTMSDADFKKAFSVFEADDQIYEKILGVKPDSPQRVAALNEVLQGIARQSVTISRYLTEQSLEGVRAQLQPVQQTFAAQRAAQHFTNFAKKYPDLSDYGPMLTEIVEAGQRRGMQFPNEDSAMKYVAERAYTLLKKQPGQAAPATSNGQPPGTQQGGSISRPMSTTSMGGRSGVSGGAAPAKSTAEALFA